VTTLAPATAIDGFWQLLVEDEAERVEPLRNTTIAVRTAGCRVYAGGRYMEFRAEKERPFPADWPPTDEEAVRMFRTHVARFGSFTCADDRDAFVVDHRPELAVDPRHLSGRYRLRFRLEGDEAATESADGDTGDDGRWRRLSGRGSSPLAGAWESVGEGERFVYLVTAGHYGVMRVEHHGVDTAAAGPNSDAGAARLFEARSLNAGAHLLASRTFDHWPMFASTAGYEIRKHPTFWLKRIAIDEFEMSFGPDDEASGVWRRLG
jgi:hypothetical protein